MTGVQTCALPISYEECTEEEYNKLKASMPTIDWTQFKEVTDNVEGAQMLACVGGVCEI